MDVQKSIAKTCNYLYNFHNLCAIWRKKKKKSYEELTDQKGIKYLHFNKNPQLGFDFEFDIFLPLNSKSDANLMLSFDDEKL